MKKSGVLNAELAHVIATLGHGDVLVIGDAGLPVPPGVACIDLAVTPGVPRLWPVLDAVLSEMEVERSVIADEAAGEVASGFAERLGASETMSHAAFKALTGEARAVVRTGETTPYANVILVSGVVF